LPIGISATKGEAALALLGPPPAKFPGQTMTVTDPKEIAGTLEKAIAVHRCFPHLPFSCGQRTFTCVFARCCWGWIGLVCAVLCWPVLDCVLCIVHCVLYSVRLGLLWSCWLRVLRTKRLGSHGALTALQLSHTWRQSLGHVSTTGLPLAFHVQAFFWQV
jgi:hypothetical protein